MPPCRRAGVKPWPNLLASRCLLIAAALGLAAPIPDVHAQNLTFPGNRDFILQIDAGDPRVRLAVHTAITGAYRRLASPKCQQIFGDFEDRNGHALRENLQATGLTAQGYLGLLRYSRGSSDSACRRSDILAFTQPATRIVYICDRFVERFLPLSLEQREELDIALIHEVLHTLGLGENPPSPQRITEQIRRRCGS
jgi:hypothetical protein